MSSYWLLVWQRCSQFCFSLTHQKISKVSRMCKDLYSLSPWTSHSTLFRTSFWSSQMNGLSSYVKWTTICTTLHHTSGLKSFLKCLSRSWFQLSSGASFTTPLDTTLPLKTSCYLNWFWFWCTMLPVDTHLSFLHLSPTSSSQSRSLQSWLFHSCSSLVSSCPQTTSHGISKSSNIYRSSSMVTRHLWETSLTNTTLRKMIGKLWASQNLMTVPTHACARTMALPPAILSHRLLWNQT